MRTRYVPSLIVVALIVTSCATRAVLLEVDPADAVVSADTQRIPGRSPFSFTVKFSERDPTTQEFLPRTVLLRKEEHESAEIKVPFANEPFREKVALRKISKKMPLVEVDPSGEIRTRYVTAMMDTIERSSAVRGARQLTNYTEADCAEPVLHQIERIDASPTDGRIVYALSFYSDPRAKKRSSNVWVVEEGVALSKLTGAETIDLDPTFSGDGKTIYFASDRLGPMAIYSISSTAPAGITTVTAGGGMDTWPTYDSGNDQIVYTSLPPQAKVQQVWTVPSNGLRRMQLRQGFQPCWSPKGDWICFVNIDPLINRSKVWLMKPDGSSMKQITQGDGDDIMPCFSPSGTRIAFASNRRRVASAAGAEEPNFDLWVMQSDGTILTQITENRSHDDFPTWTNDERSILFRSNRGGAWNIWSVDLADSGQAPKGPGQ